MKKLIAILLTLALVISAAAAFTFIGSADGSELTIPKLATAPKIDGKITNGEWATGGKCTLTPENAKFSSAKVDASGDFYWCWADDGLYILAVVKDATIATTKYAAGAALNVTDGIQLELDPLNTKANGYSKSYIFDFVPQSQAGGAIWFEHFRWASGTTADILEVAAEMTDDGYVIEVHLKWDALKKLNEDFAVAEGTKMGFGNILMDIDANHNALIADYSEICNAAKFNTLVLGAVAEPDLAGEGGGNVDPAPAPAGGCGNNG